MFYYFASLHQFQVNNQIMVREAGGIETLIKAMTIHVDNYSASLGICSTLRLLVIDNCNCIIYS